VSTLENLSCLGLLSSKIDNEPSCAPATKNVPPREVHMPLIQLFVGLYTVVRSSGGCYSLISMCAISYMVLTVNEDIAFSITHNEYCSALVVDHLL
jgi:hypothetical protein